MKIIVVILCSSAGCIPLFFIIAIGLFSICLELIGIFAQTFAVTILFICLKWIEYDVGFILILFSNCPEIQAIYYVFTILLIN